MANGKTNNPPRSLNDVIAVLNGQVFALQNKTIDREDAKVINQTTNQIMIGYKIQLSAFRLLGSKAYKPVVTGLLKK